ncbi:Growth-regulating factor 6 [Apostasia shenzhenica]|uniref:Growth-regulating factor n=1 Tax=Apostasia shenzhenica TaxID=1088818 RepID=A0A2I0BFF6_9ASPA|nr:Growth-regulating factor 6 [Apostasia shenzhenica]
MDFRGALNMDGSLHFSSESHSPFSSPFPTSASESKQRGVSEFDFSKHGRFMGLEGNEWSPSRLKTASSSDSVLTPTSKAAACVLRSNSYSLFPDGEQMLSFSSSVPDPVLLSNDGTLPFYHCRSPSAPSNLKNPGLWSTSSNMGTHGILAGIRGPFTPSQWMELEHQAMIYKYIDAKTPVPSSLLFPIGRNLKQAGFPPFTAGSYGTGTSGWGSFHMGLAGNADPEPGRCRRTDGKKWRCSRDAVVDQKYCERHMNRGRHRSRKHVEGLSGHTANAAMPTSITPSKSVSPGSIDSSYNSLTIAHRPQSKSWHPGKAEASSLQPDRLLMNKENGHEPIGNAEGLSILTGFSTRPVDMLFPSSKQKDSFDGTSTLSNFGKLISTDSLLSPPSSSYAEILSFAVAPEKNVQPSKTHHPLLHFIDDYSRNQSASHSAVSWPDVDEMHTDRTTQLSISIPITSSEFSSSSSSPNHDRLASSPARHSSWIPISWEPTLGGPLGEVLTNTSSKPNKPLSMNHSSSSLNLLTDGWDSNSRLESSPTGVLQKASFISLSSSTGSSPQAENHITHESTDLGSTMAKPSTITLL